MKLRIRDNSIRLRLSQTEVKEIAEGRLVQSTVQFARGARLHYVLEPALGIATLEARYEDHRITVLVPTAMAKHWANSDEVSLKADVPIEGDELFILVEKDFQCLKPRVHEKEDESDLFINPNEAHGSCG